MGLGNLETLDEFLRRFYTDRGKDKVFADLHIHTNYSDGFISSKSLLDYLKDKNYIIAVTDHNAVEEIFFLEKWE